MIVSELVGQYFGTKFHGLRSRYRKARLIKHGRRQIIILDCKGLEEASCECYKAIQTQLARWRDESKKDGNLR
jgi:hypothetical protein